MGSETLENTLGNFGVTEKETEVYILLAKRGAQRTGQIAKQLKMNKGLVYRILKKLQEKGLVESTLEYPTRYTAVPFEKVIDSFIKSKREEVIRIEEKKKDLLSDWEKISRSELESPLERFTVIEGNKKIYHKMSQMIKETKSQLSAISTVTDLVRAEQFGVFDYAYDHHLKPKVQFRFLTELSNENLKAMRLLKDKMKAGLDFRGRNPDLGLTAFPRMVIRDNEEIMFFITRTSQEVCLCTNCKSLIQAFTGVFNSLWHNSTDIEQKIGELETGKPTPQMILIKDAENAKRKYDNLLQNAQDEIIIVTSSEGLVEFNNQMFPLKDWTERGVAIKIMAPIIEKNLGVSQKLLEFCEVRHIPISYLGTTIIDGKHLFQFKHPPLETEKPSLGFFKSTFYTNDFEYIERTKTMLSEIWNKSSVPSAVTIESIISTEGTAIEDTDPSIFAAKNYKRVVTFSFEDQKIPGSLTEKDVLNKILRARKISPLIHSKGATKIFASMGQAIIHPPAYFKLPDMLINAWHKEKQSSGGESESLIIYLWLDTPYGSGFIPVAIVGHIIYEVTKLHFQGTPAENNCITLKKDELSVRVHGNTLFAGWTVPLPLFPPQYTLPPSSLLLEGFGKVKTGRLSWAYRNGVKQDVEFNAFEALVTFFHPESKYSGPGTDGILFREWIGEMYIPEKFQHLHDNTKIIT